MSTLSESSPTRTTSHPRVGLFDNVAGWFSGAVNGVVDVAKRAWGAIRTVWHIFGTLATLVGSAWDWMVNGVEWLGLQVGHLGEATYAALWHLFTSVIPEAAFWALRRAVGWAVKEAGKVEHWATGMLHTLTGWALHEIRSLWHWITHAVGSLYNDVRGVLHWIEHTANRVIDMVLRPAKLVKWILGSLVAPLVLFFIRSSAPVITMVLRGARQHMNEFAHTVEDVLHDLL